MASEGKFVKKFMHATEKFQKVFGPADHGDIDEPVVHRHDAVENESDEVLSHIRQRTDSSGHRYAFNKDEEEEL